jgi:hypothetical protein
MTAQIQTKSPGAGRNLLQDIQPSRHPSNSRGAKTLPAWPLYFMGGARGKTDKY